MVERILHIIKVVFYLCILIITIFSALLLLLFYIYSRNKKIISSLVFVDSVTGGFNLNKFQIESKNILISNPNKDYALVVLDVNNFKYINDVFGYNEGNRLICHISNMLIQNLNKHEICGRVNNDIFSILVEFLGEDHLLHRLNIISNNISNIDSSFVINHNITINCGIYVIDDKNIDIYHMIDMATLAITTIKGGSKSAYVFFNEDIRLKLNEGKEIEISMESALDNKEFQIYIQPKFNLKNRNIIGAEALIRWSHPVKGMISPDNFIPIFEKNGFISKIDTYVFEEVCKQIQEQINNGYTPIPISVNFSRVHISNLNLIYTYKELAEKYNIPTHLIEIEITENFAIDNTNALQNIIIKLKQMGFTVSMDDFGSGYSSLNMLKDIPVDVLKLDKNFLHENSNNDRGKIIISNIITMAKQLDMKVICEGVELESQANFLEEMGCDAAQGFFFDRPMPINIFNKKFY
ncbi:MAG: GGDEF domain-containing phosphodiesterase [Clostridium sp.]